MEPTRITTHRKATFGVIGAPQGFIGRVSDLWIGPVRKTAGEAYLDADFTDLPYTHEHPIGLIES